MSDFFNISMPPQEQARFKRWLNKLDVDTQNRCKTIVKAAVVSTHRRAVLKAPVNKQVGQGGFLRSSLSWQMYSGGLGGVVYSRIKYAPYMEFGTGKYASAYVPTLDPEVQKYAATFKGKGIRKVNVRQRPYLLPAVDLAVKEMKARLRSLGFKEK